MYFITNIAYKSITATLSPSIVWECIELSLVFREVMKSVKESSGGGRDDLGVTIIFSWASSMIRIIPLEMDLRFKKCMKLYYLFQINIFTHYIFVNRYPFNLLRCPFYCNYLKYWKIVKAIIMHCYTSVYAPDNFHIGPLDFTWSAGTGG